MSRGVRDMSWLKWNCGLTRKREILIMASALSMRPVYVAAHFMLVMEWADGETDTGDIAGLPVSVLDEYAQCSGFGQAMVNVGWVEVYYGGFRFTNYERHNGTSTKKRLAAASRQNRKRDRETALQESRPKRDKSHTKSVTSSSLLSSSLISSDSSVSESQEGESEGKPKRKHELEPDWPPTHNRPDVCEAWTEWIAYRKERGIQPYKPRGLKAAVTTLTQYPPEAIVWAIRQSMANTWTGLFPEKWSQQNGHAGRGGSASGGASTTDQRRADKRAREFGDGDPLDLPIVVV